MGWPVTIEALITQYGALAVFAGAALEGETAAFLGGVVAHRHLLPYWQAALAAALGSLLADQALFLIGRHASTSPLVRRYIARDGIARVRAMLNAHPTVFILSFRFIYGARTVSPVIIGLSTVSPGRFLLLNMISASTWGILITAAGYLLGNTIEATFGHLGIHIHLAIALAGILALVAAAWCLLHAFLRKRGPIS